MRILGLDQSPLHTGWALWDSGEPLPRSGAWPLCEGIAKRALGFVELHRHLAAIHAERPIDLIVYETPELMPTDRREKLVAIYGVVAHIESYAHVKRISLLSIAARDWRKTFFNGMVVKGRDSLKRAAIERCRQFGMDPLSDDEAEACGILDHVMHVQRITPPWRLANPLVGMLAA